jgi:hypothetical protein
MAMPVDEAQKSPCCFAKAGLDSDIPEFQGHEIKPPSFEA